MKNKIITTGLVLAMGIVPAISESKISDKPNPLWKPVKTESDSRMPKEQAKSSTDESDELTANVQITELGCMRVLLLLDSSALNEEKIIAQRFSDVDFRIFPSSQVTEGRMTLDKIKQIAKEAAADLVFYANIQDRLKNSLGDFRIYEAEATIQVYSSVSGELLVSSTNRAMGQRNCDDVDARRSAREKVLDPAIKDAVAKTLEKSHKILVHRAKIINVGSHERLLHIMEYMQKMQGVYHVRQVSYNKPAKEAVIEIIGAPRSASFWRAYLEKMPKLKVSGVDANKQLRQRYPSWF